MAANPGDLSGDPRIAQIGQSLRSTGVTGGETRSPADQVSPSATPTSDSANQHGIDGQDLPPM
jgi:hypothetical protein